MVYFRNMGGLRNMCIIWMVLFFFFLACDKDQKDQSDKLLELDILGEWQLESLSFNGIIDLSVPCCDFLELDTGNETYDLKGNFVASGTAYETGGTFELNTAYDSILFDSNNSHKKCHIQLMDDTFVLTYDEKNQNIIESWKRLKFKN
jgi:hypothetical protein